MSWPSVRFAVVTSASPVVVASRVAAALVATRWYWPDVDRWLTAYCSAIPEPCFPWIEGIITQPIWIG